MTRYVILEKQAGAVAGQSGGGHWTEQAIAEAASDKQAIKKHLGGKGQGASGTFCAVPERSFKPVTVTARTETKLTFG